MTTETESNTKDKPLALIVEDDPQLATIFSMAFEIAGFETEAIGDGLTAKENLGDVYIPDVVLLDVHLPHVSGEELFRLIKADARLTDTKVVMSTADSRVASQLKDEAHLVLLKPVSFKELVELAKNLF